jgi:hypothetical protein
MAEGSKSQASEVSTRGRVTDRRHASGLGKVSVTFEKWLSMHDIVENMNMIRCKVVKVSCYTLTFHTQSSTQVVSSASPFLHSPVTGPFFRD